MQRGLLSCLASASIRTLKWGIRMASSKQNSYKDAIRTLNKLQSNAAQIAYVIRTGEQDRDLRMREIESCLRLLEISVDDIDTLSVIHVSGTKGKGSVCAMVESILRHSSLKTGLFTSPHLVEVRERIRINGQPLPHDRFASYFWDCYEKLKELEEQSEPQYFTFLTAMGFYVFLKENVDVAIVEVGIGGALDYTNIVRKPVVCGISSLGYDHTAILGDTIEKIAWQKAGILKEGVPAFTVKQDAGGLPVIEQRARDLKIPLYVVSELSKYPGQLPELSLAGEYQHTNASLALQLCNSWMIARDRDRDGKVLPVHRLLNSYESAVAPTFDLTDSQRRGLKKCWWPGRSQVISRPRITYFLDGAHTPRSLKACRDWFLKTLTSKLAEQSGPLAYVLLFNCTSGRDPIVLLKELKEIDFQFAIFCPNVAVRDDPLADQTSYRVDDETNMSTCRNNELAWHTVTGCSHNTAVFSSVHDAICWLDQGRDPLLDSLPKDANTPDLPLELAAPAHLQLLITGSIHLVGAVFRALGPEIAPLYSTE